MGNSKLAVTPFNAVRKLTKSTKESELFNQEVYKPSIGNPLYLSARRRPDIAYVVGNEARFSSQPRKQHWKAVKHYVLLKRNENL